MRRKLVSPKSVQKIIVIGPGGVRETIHKRKKKRSSKKTRRAFLRGALAATAVGAAVRRASESAPSLASPAFDLIRRLRGGSTVARIIGRL